MSDRPIFEPKPATPTSAAEAAAKLNDLSMAAHGVVAANRAHVGGANAGGTQGYADHGAVTVPRAQVQLVAPASGAAWTGTGATRRLSCQSVRFAPSTGYAVDTNEPAFDVYNARATDEEPLDWFYAVLSLDSGRWELLDDGLGDGSGNSGSGGDSGNNGGDASGSGGDCTNCPADPWPDGPDGNQCPDGYSPVYVATSCVCGSASGEGSTNGSGGAECPFLCFPDTAIGDKCNPSGSASESGSVPPINTACCANAVPATLTVTFDGATGTGWNGQTLEITYDANDGYWSGSKTITGCNNADFQVEFRLRCHDPGAGPVWQYYIDLTGGDCTAWTPVWTEATTSQCDPFEVTDDETTAAACCDLFEDGLDFTVTE